MVTLRVVAGAAAVTISIAAQAETEPLRIDIAGVLLAQAPSDGAEATAQPVAASPKTKFGEMDSWRWMLQGGGGIDVSDSHNRFALFGAGVSYFIIDNLSLDLELNGLYFDQNGSDAPGINFTLLFRWHFFAREEWSIYLDGGAGLMKTTSNVPAESLEEPTGGSSFNFTPQLGVGLTLAVDDQARLFAGIRWYHVSNGQIFEQNPGRDHVYLYAGVSFPF